MKFVAEIQALDPLTKKLKTYCDVIEIPVDNIDDANYWCQKNYKGYMWVTGFFEREIELTKEDMNRILKSLEEKCKCTQRGYMDNICFNCGLPIK